MARAIGGLGIRRENRVGGDGSRRGRARGDASREDHRVGRTERRGEEFTDQQISIRKRADGRAEKRGGDVVDALVRERRRLRQVHHRLGHRGRRRRRRQARQSLRRGRALEERSERVRFTICQGRGRAKRSWEAHHASRQSASARRRRIPRRHPRIRLPLARGFRHRHPRDVFPGDSRRDRRVGRAVSILRLHASTRAGVRRRRRPLGRATVRFILRTLRGGETDRRERASRARSRVSNQDEIRRGQRRDEDGGQARDQVAPTRQSKTRAHGDG